MYRSDCSCYKVKMDDVNIFVLICLLLDPPRIRHRRRNQDVLYFKFSDKVQDNKVLKAKLWLWLKDSNKPLEVGPEEPITISVLKISRISTEETLQLSPITTIKVSS